MRRLILKRCGCNSVGGCGAQPAVLCLALQTSPWSQAQPCTLARELRQIRFSDVLCHGCSKAAHRVSEALCSSCSRAAYRLIDTLRYGCSRAAVGGESYDTELSMLSHLQSALPAESLVTTLACCTMKLLALGQLHATVLPMQMLEVATTAAELRQLLSLQGLAADYQTVLKTQIWKIC